MFHTPAERTASENASTDQGNDVITAVSAAVGAIVAMAIAVTLLMYCLKRAKPRHESENGRPYLQDLIELRMLNRDVWSEVSEGTANMKAFHDSDQNGIAGTIKVHIRGGSRNLTRGVNFDF